MCVCPPHLNLHLICVQGVAEKAYYVSDYEEPGLMKSGKMPHRLWMNFLDLINGSGCGSAMVWLVPY
jgi:hypothetical protein